MATNGSTNYINSSCGFIDISFYFTNSTETSESYYNTINSILRYENENPRIPIKLLHSVKIKVHPFKAKSSRNIGYTKHFIGHTFRVGKSKK